MDDEPLVLRAQAERRHDDDHDHAFRLVARGDIDATTAPHLAESLDALVEQGATLVVLDAADVEFLDSSGLRVITLAGNQLTARGGRLLIEGMSATVQRILEISGLLDHYRAR
jgi:anti-sigma B factor antagonist